MNIRTAQVKLVTCVILCLMSRLAHSEATTSAHSGYPLDLSLRELMNVQVVTSASGFEQKLSTAPASITIITAEQWQNKGATSLSQALQGLTSIQLNSVLTGNSFEKYSIRGLSGAFGQQVLLLVDGVPMNRPHHGGTPSFIEFPLHGFERIEIIRSPGSVVYGADAFAGIINLISYDTDDHVDELEISTGEFQQRNASLITSTDWNSLSLNMAINYQHFGDDPDRFVYGDLQTTFDGFFGTSASRAPGNIDNSRETFTFNTRLSWENLQVQYYYVDNTSGYGSGVAQALDPDSSGTFTQHVYASNYDLSEAVTGNLSLSAWYKKQVSISPFKIFPSGAVLPIGSSGNLDFATPTTFALFSEGYIGIPGNTTKQYHISLVHLINPTDNHKVRTEIGYQKQNYHAFEQKNFGPTVLDGTETLVDSTLTDVTGTIHNYMPDVSRKFHYISIQDEWHIKSNLLLNLGVRYDDYSDFGSTTNPRASISWAATNDLTLRAFLGTAFRAPSFIDLHAQNNPAAQGNVNVEPEKITTREVTINYQANDHLFASLTYFNYRAHKLIDHVTDPVSGLAYTQNVGELEASGVEMEVLWQPKDNLKISSNFSHISSENNSGEDTPNIATELANIAIDWRISTDLYLNISTSWILDRERPAPDLRDKLDNYNLTSAKISHKGLIDGLELSIVANNLLDDNDAIHPSNGSIADDFPLAGRQLLAQLTYQF